jgi:hypothetical protein
MESVKSNIEKYLVINGEIYKSNSDQLREITNKLSPTISK